MLVYSSIHICRHRHTETCLYTQTREHTSFFEESRIQIHMNKYKCTPRTHTDARKETHKNIDTLTNRKAQMRVRVGCILLILVSLIILFSLVCCFGRASHWCAGPDVRIKTGTRKFSVPSAKMPTKMIGVHVTSYMKDAKRQYERNAS